MSHLTNRDIDRIYNEYMKKGTKYKICLDCGFDWIGSQEVCSRCGSDKVIDKF